MDRHYCHKYEILPDCSSVGFDIDIQNFIYVAFTRKRSIMEYVQVRYALPTDAAQNYDRPTSVPVMFTDLRIMVSLPWFSLDLYMMIGKVKIVSRVVLEQY